METPIKRGPGRPASPNPKKKTAIYLSPDIIADVDKYAAEDGKTRSEFVSMILERSVYRRRRMEGL